MSLIAKQIINFNRMAFPKIYPKPFKIWHLKFFPRVLLILLFRILNNVVSYFLQEVLIRCQSKYRNINRVQLVFARKSFLLELQLNSTSAVLKQ